MDIRASLIVVGWIYVAMGGVVCIEELVSLFAPFDERTASLEIVVPLNLAMLALPAGIGLLRGRSYGRSLALFLSWVALLFVVFVVGVFTLGVLNGNEITVSEGAAFGESLAGLLSWLFVGVPLFVWQFRVLRSPEVQAMVQVAA